MFFLQENFFLKLFFVNDFLCFPAIFSISYRGKIIKEIKFKWNLAQCPFLTTYNTMPFYSFSPEIKYEGRKLSIIFKEQSLEKY